MPPIIPTFRLVALHHLPDVRVVVAYILNLPTGEVARTVGNRETAFG